MKAGSSSPFKKHETKVKLLQVIHCHRKTDQNITNTRFDGQKVHSDICPEFVRRRLLADLGADTGWFGCELSRNPRLQGEKWFLKAAFQAEYALHRPGKVVASAYADWFCVLKVGAREASSAGNEL